MSLTIGLTLKDLPFLAQSVGIVTSGLLIQNEAEWDALTNGTAVASWSDISGNGRAWNAVTAGTVDTSIKAGAHNTLKFTASAGQGYNQSSSFGASGFAGLEMMVVMRHAADPPNDPQGAGGIVTFNQNDNAATHQPYADDHFYENLGTATRLNLGTSGVNTASAFVLYNVAAAADGSAYDAWVNNTNFAHLTSGYTFNQQGNVDKPGGASPGYRLGNAIFVGFAVYFFTGNVAAVFAWNRRLTSAERTQMRAYVANKYGVLVS